MAAIAPSPVRAPSPRVRHRGRITVLVAATLALSGVAAVTSPAGVAEAQQACTAAVPADEIVPGLVAEGLTVTRGTTPEPFGAEILGVLPDGIAPGLDLVLAELDSPAVDEAGVWAGMSGSPVLTEDGRLVGAVAYSLSWGPSSIAGLVPGEAMLELDDYPGALSARSPSVIKVGASEAADLGLAAGGRATGEMTLRRLALPVAVSALQPERMDAVRDRLGIASDVPMYPIGSGAGASQPATAADEIVAGGNFAAALSYGALTVAAVGTTTDVCDGRALAFGHPFQFAGKTELTAHAADAILVQPDSQGGSFKVATIGGVAGTLDQDRLAGVRAQLGEAPVPSEVYSRVHSATTGKARSATTWVNQDVDVPDIAAFHLLSSLDRGLDKIGGGRTRVAWTATGTADGRPFTLGRVNRFANPWDVSWDSINELGYLLWLVGNTGLADVEFDGVDVRVAADEEYQRRAISRVEVAVNRGRSRLLGNIDRLVLRAGDEVTVEVNTKMTAGPARLDTKRVRFTVPRRLRGQSMRLAVYGGETLANRTWAEPSGSSFDGLLRAIGRHPVNNAVVARLERNGEDGPERLVGSQRMLGDTVTGRATVRARVVD